MTEDNNLLLLAERGLLAVTKRNLRHFIKAASFKCENDREAALNCLDVIEDELSGSDDLIAVLRAALNAESALAQNGGSDVR